MFGDVVLDRLDRSGQIVIDREQVDHHGGRGLASEFGTALGGAAFEVAIVRDSTCLGLLEFGDAGLEALDRRFLCEHDRIDIGQVRGLFRGVFIHRLLFAHACSDPVYLADIVE